MLGEKLEAWCARFSLFINHVSVNISDASIVGRGGWVSLKWLYIRVPGEY